MGHHTKGEWRVGALKSWLGTGEPVAYVYRPVVGEDVRTRIQVLGGHVDADAALIAAAPKLLRALKKLLKGMNYGEHTKARETAIIAALQAIADAEGKR